MARSKADHEQIQTSLPLSAYPAAGALSGTFVLAAVLAGQVGWMIALIAPAAMTQRKLRIGQMVSVRHSTLRRLAKAANRFAALIGRAGVLRSFAVGLVSALLAALGAWPTPGLFRDPESNRPDKSKLSG